MMKVKSSHGESVKVKKKSKPEVEMRKEGGFGFEVL